MNSNDPHPDSFRKLIHDLNQIVFLVRGHCDLAQMPGLEPEKLQEHLKSIQECLEDFERISKALKQKQLELAPEE